MLPQFVRDVIERRGGRIPLLLTVVRQLGVSNTDDGHGGPGSETAGSLTTGQPGSLTAHLTAVCLHLGQDHLSLAQAEVVWLHGKCWSSLSLTQWPAVRTEHSSQVSPTRPPSSIPHSLLDQLLLSRSNLSYRPARVRTKILLHSPI